MVVTMKDELTNILTECNNELIEIKNKISEAPHDRIVKYLTNYALIKAYGTIEFIYISIIKDCSKQLSDPKLHSYLDYVIGRDSKSAKYDNMGKILKQFNNELHNTFKRNIQNTQDCDKIISSLNSLVNNRNNFAHGRPQTASFDNIKQYYDDSIKIIQIFNETITEYSNNS